MTLHEVDRDVLSRMPPQNRLPVLTDHENAEMYKKVNQSVYEFKSGKPPAMSVPLSDIPKILKDLRAKLEKQEQEKDQS